MKQPITFDQLPATVSALRDDIAFIKELLQNSGKTPKETDRWLCLKELCEYLPGHPAPPTIYSWVHSRKIPHKKLGKRLAFLKSEIDFWLKEKTQNTIAEIEKEVNY